MKTERHSRLRRSPARKFAPTVVFIHHFGGNYLTTHRHQDMVLKMGFDCYSFNLSEQHIPRWEGLWPDSLGRFGRGIVERWADELETVLNQLEGEKILFSFSYPSTCVPALLARAQRPDVRAWICDGGPFLEMFRCQWNLFTYGLRIEGAFKRFALACIGYLIMGGPAYSRKVRHWLMALDTKFPILSLRAGRDRLVPARAIDKFFAKNPSLNLQRFEFPQSAHLEELKDSPSEYRAQVEGFLTPLL